MWGIRRCCPRSSTELAVSAQHGPGHRAKYRQIIRSHTSGRRPALRIIAFIFREFLEGFNKSISCFSTFLGHLVNKLLQIINNYVLELAWSMEEGGMCSFLHAWSIKGNSRRYCSDSHTYSTDRYPDRWWVYNTSHARVPFLSWFIQYSVTPTPGYIHWLRHPVSPYSPLVKIMLRQNKDICISTNLWKLKRISLCCL